METKRSRRNIFKDQRGFTLIEIIAVLIVLGILAAVAIPKYMGVTEEARNQAARGQIAEVKGRLSQALARYMLANEGAKPDFGDDLVTEANGYVADSCRADATEEDDFTFFCTGAEDAQTVLISVTVVQSTTLDAAITDTYNFAD